MFKRGIGPVFQFRGLEEHIQEIARIGELVIGVGIGHSETVAIGEGGKSRHFADETIGLLAPGVRVEDMTSVGVKSGERGNRGNQHAHGVGVIMKAVEEFLDALMNEGVMGDVVTPFLELFARGKFAKNNQIGGFEIAASLGQFLNGVSAIAENTLIAVNEGDLALAEGRIIEGGIVAHHAEVVLIQLDLAEVESANRIFRDGYFVGFTGTIVGDGERVPAHAIGLSNGRLGCGFDWIHVLCLSLSLQGSPSMYTKSGYCGIAS